MARSNPLVDGILRVVRDVANRTLDRATQPNRRQPSKKKSRLNGRLAEQPKTAEQSRAADRSAEQSRAADRSAEQSQRTHKNSSGYPGDYKQRPHIVYQPVKDGRPDPGEVIWTWVPYEEDFSQGKDRPVLLIGRDGEWLLGLQVTSKDNDRDTHEARAGRYWMDIGAGEWDNRRRPSEVRVNRIIRIDPDAVRRVGAILDEVLFNEVADEVLRRY